MIFKIVTMGKQEIPLEDEEAVQKFFAMANTGMKLVMTKYGVVNVASVDSIVPDVERNNSLKAQRSYGLSVEDAETQVLGPSPFAKLLAARMSSLNTGEARNLEGR